MPCRIIPCPCANRTCVLLASEDMITQRIDAHLAKAKRATVSVGKHLGDGSSETPAENNKSTGDPPALELHGGDRLNNLSIKICNRSSHAIRPTVPSAHYASLLEYNDKIVPYMRRWSNQFGAKITEDARILLDASLNLDIVTASHLLHAFMISSTPLRPSHVTATTMD